MKQITPILLALCAWGLAAAAGAEPGDAGFDQRVLDALREQGAISQQQYEALSREVRAQRRAAQAEAVPAVSAAQDDPEAWKAYWKDGFRIERNDGLFKLKFGGRIHVDAAAIGAEDDLRTFEPDLRGTGAEIRRARMFMEGSFYENGIFKAEYDFAGGDADFNDLFVGLRDLPYAGRVRVGHTKEAFGLDALTSSKYVAFMERPSPVEAFAPVRNLGIQANNTAFGERMTWHVGGYKDVDSVGGGGFSQDSNYNVTGRATGLPLYADGGRQLIHLGVAYSHKFRSDTVSYSARPESHLADALVDTGDIPTSGVNQLGLEFASVTGPVTLQAELIPVWVNRRGGSDLMFWGAYGEVSWFVTGENRQYDPELGHFGRTRLRRRFSPQEGSWGALELAARYSYLDLNDDNVRGGVESNASVGANWYLYSNFRIMLDYVHAHRNGVGDANIVQSRFSLDF